MAGLFVDLLGIEHALNFDRVAVAIPPAEKAGGISLVAGGPADLFDLQQDCIRVAVDVNRLHPLHMAAFFSLFPELLAAAAVVNSVPRGERLLPGVLVHIAKH